MMGPKAFACAVFVISSGAAIAATADVGESRAAVVSCQNLIGNQISTGMKADPVLLSSDKLRATLAENRALYRTAISSFYVINAQKAKGTVTGVSYNPIYDVALIQSIKTGSDESGGIRCADRMRLSSFFFVTGAVLRRQKQSDLPHWVQAGNLLGLTADVASAARAAANAGIIRFPKITDLIDERVRSEQYIRFIQQGMKARTSGEGSGRSDAEVVAYGITECMRSTDIGVASSCIAAMMPPKAKVALPLNLDQAAYAELLRDEEIGGIVNQIGGKSLIFIMSNKPLSGRYAMVAQEKKGKLIDLALLPLF